jgi:hypothetical protein
MLGSYYVVKRCVKRRGAAGIQRRAFSVNKLVDPTKRYSLVVLVAIVIIRSGAVPTMHALTLKVTSSVQHRKILKGRHVTR